MLSQAIKRYKPKKGTILFGKVKPRNLPSIKVFKSLGFEAKLNKKYYFRKNY
jgi:L-amino acid N-acyltransferase YncA